jgi:hypothetical protein
MRSAIVLIIAAFCGLPGAARAQDAGAAAAACASIENEHDRLACYDRALRAVPPAPEPAAAPGAQENAATPAARSTAAAPAAAVTAVSATPTSPEASAAPPAPSVDARTGQPTGVIPIVVLSARARPGRGVEFTTDRGGVWLQTDTQPLNLPPTPFNAQLKPGTLGGVFLVPENRLGIRVRRQ